LVERSHTRVRLGRFSYRHQMPGRHRFLLSKHRERPRTPKTTQHTLRFFFWIGLPMGQTIHCRRHDAGSSLRCIGLARFWTRPFTEFAPQCRVQTRTSTGSVRRSGLRSTESVDAVWRRRRCCWRVFALRRFSQRGRLQFLKLSVVKRCWPHCLVV
jgi:hypothetical protein